ncbi:MAG: N-acetylmuramoyl-L-alanine amidase [Candidatus Aminicenantes bacterium]|nr:N-acetylmuramoyl-L-alanine amidase [Candidatus Aminicenantes bacterium]
MPSQTNGLIQAKVEDKPGATQIVITCNQPLEVFFNKFGQTLEVRLNCNQPLRFRSDPIKSSLIRSLGWASTKKGYVLAIDCSLPDFQYQTLVQHQPFQVEIELRPVVQEKISELSKLKEAKEEGPRLEEMEKEKSSVGSIGIEGKKDEHLFPLARKIKTIVLDPGHGGLETGAKGPGGTLEKDITLAIALKLKEIIERNLALRVVLTRDQDIDVSLENRAALANNNRADLFISIHANGAFRPKAHGSETYFLSLRASDEEARRLAYLENNSPEFEKKIEEENQDQIMMILWDMAQATFLKQSSELAEIIQIELNKLLGTANRGVKQAPFKVLTGVACPAVLVEVAFISNPEEEIKLRDENFQQAVALAIYQGILNYLRKIS